MSNETILQLYHTYVVYNFVGCVAILTALIVGIIAFVSCLSYALEWEEPRAAPLRFTLNCISCTITVAAIITIIYCQYIIHVKIKLEVAQYAVPIVTEQLLPEAQQAWELLKGLLAK